MRDPHIHVERGIGQLTNAELRQAFTAVTGVAVDAPKTVTTGCGRRRPYAMTSLNPAAVTCLACREHAAAQFDVLAGMAEAVASLTDPGAIARIAAKAGGPETAAAQACGYRARAAAFRGSPGADGNGRTCR
jgi:hypothetical protein